MGRGNLLGVMWSKNVRIQVQICKMKVHSCNPPQKSKLYHSWHLSADQTIWHTFPICDILRHLLRFQLHGLAFWVVLIILFIVKNVADLFHMLDEQQRNAEELKQHIFLCSQLDRSTIYIQYTPKLTQKHKSQDFGTSYISVLSALFTKLQSWST